MKKPKYNGKGIDYNDYFDVYAKTFKMPRKKKKKIRKYLNKSMDNAITDCLPNIK